MIRLARYDHSIRPIGMFEYSVAASNPVKYPTILLEQPDDVTNLQHKSRLLHGRRCRNERLHQPQRPFEILQIKSLEWRMGVAGLQADEGGRDALLDQGVAIAAEELPDGVLNRDTCFIGDVGKPPDQILGVVGAGILVDKRRSATQPGRQRAPVDGRDVTYRAVVQGNREIDIKIVAYRACTDESDLFLNRRAEVEIVGELIAIEIFEQQGHDRQGEAVVDRLASDPVSDASRRRIPDHSCARMDAKF